ncbi:hypothetical protein KDA_76800 [Dictyobacter alpinus]|uniref:HAMP domain-containing protein n=1 Tax=Dictyobacter alpinus TaxID=2014873 RepID=A0A402BLJ3_9CHLR|nr:hypothetical protein [Dictyobacter alpinus]GCE32196.1 hypothetical protein KDA_76800 [Dictyobacter alpinus]
MILSLCFLPMFPIMVFFSPESPSSPPAAFLAGFTLIGAWIAGRVRWQKISASLVILYILDTVMIPILFNPTLPLILIISYSFIIAIVLAGALIVPRASIIVAALTCAFLLIVVFFLPHPKAYIQTVSAYNYSVMVYLPIFIFFVIGISMTVILGQLNQTILRADRAEEIIVLQEEIGRYEERRRAELADMEEGVKLIAEAHRQFANGNVQVRVPIDTLSRLGENNALVRVAFSLNNLLGRVQRWREESAMAERTELVVNELVHDLQRRPTDTLSDQLPLRTGTLVI